MAQTMNLPIHSLVPHEGTMSLLDTLVTADETGSACTLEIRPGATFSDEHGVPALVGIEYMAQAIAAQGGYLAQLKGDPAPVGFLLGTPKLTSNVCHFPFGSHLRIEVAKDWGDDEMMHYVCRILDHTDGRLLMEAGLNVFQPRDLPSYLAKNHA